MYKEAISYIKNRPRYKEWSKGEDHIGKLQIQTSKEIHPSPKQIEDQKKLNEKNIMEHRIRITKKQKVTLNLKQDIIKK